MMNYLLASVFIPFLFVTPGLLAASFLKRKDLVEMLCISFFLSFVVIGIFGILLKLIGINLNFLATSIFVIFIILLSLTKFQKIKEALKVDKTTKLIILIFLTGYFVKIILQIFIPFYPLGGDWFENYNRSLIFFSNSWEFKTRPPFFNYLIAFCMSLFGKDLWVAQVATTFLNSIFIFPFFLLSRKFFNKQVSVLATIFVSFNPLLIENALYIWPKNFVGFFILLFFYLLMEKNKNWFLLGGTIGMSMLIHQLSLFYILTGLFVLYMLHKTKIFLSKGFFTMVLTALIFFSPWVLYTATQKDLANIVFLYYPFAVEGYEKTLNATFTEVWRTFSSKPLSYIIGVRIVNLINTLLPVIPTLKVVNLFVPIPTIYLHKIVNISSLPLAYHYFHSIPGNLTLLLSLFVFLGIIKAYKTGEKKRRILLMMTLLPVIFTDLFYGWIVPGLARQTLQPIIPLLILIGIWYVGSLKHKRLLIAIIILLTVVETVIFIYSYYEYFISTSEFLSKIGVLDSWTGQNSAYNIFKSFQLP